MTAVSPNSRPVQPAVAVQMRTAGTVFLDRDGVINRKLPEGEYVRQWDQIHLLPGVAEAITSLRRAGRTVLVVTNQRGISLGYSTEAEIRAIHERLNQQLRQLGAQVDAFYLCPHGRGQCDCRKPGPGMFRAAFADYPESSPASSVMVGDSLSDIEAAHGLGIPSIFITGDQHTRAPGWEKAMELASASAASLAEAVELYLSPEEREELG